MSDSEEAVTDPETAVARIEQSVGDGDLDAETYRLLFEAIDDFAGGTAVEDLAEWTLDRVDADGTAPDPEAVRDRARRLCLERGVKVPGHSPLSREYWQ